MGPGARDEVVERAITTSALAGERAVSIARLLFCVAVGVRAGWMWAATSIAAGHEAARAWITFPALAIAIGFSIAVLTGAGGRRPALVLHLSVAIDAVVAFVVLLPNVLWPGDGYQGAPFMIDTAVVLPLAVAAGLRHVPTAALLAGALHAAGYTALAVTDQHVSAAALPAHTASAHAMYAILLGAAVAIAVVIAMRGRRLSAEGARAARNARQAGDGLRTVLREHHDLRAVVTSAQLNVDLLVRRGGARRGDEVDHLREDLDELRHQLEQVKGRVVEELAGLEARQPAAIDEVSAEVVAALRPRFPAVQLDAAAAAAAPPALVAGGPPALRRILANVVVNACEGDGARAAQRVAISARRVAPGVVIEIRDDGPGLPAHVLAAPVGDAVSTKAVGSGLGIGLVDGLVRASGGSVSWRNHPGGGASVVVTLPAAE